MNTELEYFLNDKYFRQQNLLFCVYLRHLRSKPLIKHIHYNYFVVQFEGLPLTFQLLGPDPIWRSLHLCRPRRLYGRGLLYL